MLEIKLSKNLRKSILQGHPWIYRDAILPTDAKTQLCHIVDSKGLDLGWGYYDQKSPIAVRVLSLKKDKPDLDFYFKRMQLALNFRTYLDKSKTNGYRLFNGEGDKLPGLVCDIYANVAVVQLDGQGAYDFWPKEEIAKWLLDNASVDTVIARSREDKANFLSWGKEVETDVIILENSVKFKVNIIKGQKTGFFLDQRENREYIRTHAKNKTVLNLFSYTGGFSMFAGLGGAKHVTSVDVAKDALDYATDNWALNELPRDKHEIKKEDAFEFIKTTQEKWDMIIVDPPSMAHNERDKYKAITKYTEVFADSAKRLTAGGSLILSSCSSHISFEEFFSMIEEALSKARTSGQVFRVTGQAADHPFLHVGRELRYLKFFHLILE